MPPSLLKASPSAMNLLKKVSANIHLSYPAATCFWPGQVPWQLPWVLAIGVTLPDQEVPLPRVGEELLGWPSEGNTGCPAGEWHG